MTIIAVAGGSGSGKTTVVQRLLTKTNPDQTLHIQHDNYYKDQSGLTLPQRLKTNYDHPDSLQTELLIQHLQDLSEGKTIQQPVYDFTQHTRSTQTNQLSSKQMVIVEGILLFVDPSLRKMFDLKIFVDTPDDIRFIRRLKRDIAERGRTLESVVDQYYQTVRPMHHQFVEPSKQYADLIIPEGGHNEKALAVLDSYLQTFYD